MNIKHTCFVLLVGLLYIDLSAQQNNQLIPGLPNDITKCIPCYMANAADSYNQCMQMMKNFSQTSKQWYTVTREYASAYSLERKMLGLILSKKFSLQPCTAVIWGKETVEDQLSSVNTSMQRFDYLKDIGVSLEESFLDYSYREECLGHAIIQGEKIVVAYLCGLPAIQPNYLMKVDESKIPLLVLALQENADDNDTFIIECLLKAGANPRREYVNNQLQLKGCTAYGLALAHSDKKPKTFALIEKYEKSITKPTRIWEPFK